MTLRFGESVLQNEQNLNLLKPVFLFEFHSVFKFLGLQKTKKNNYILFLKCFQGVNLSRVLLIMTLYVQTRLYTPTIKCHVQLCLHSIS